jgi:Immunity protein Imm1
MSRVESNSNNVKAPGQWRLLDWERSFVIIDSEKTLKATLSGLLEKADTPNRIVELESPEGDKLSIGIAGPTDSDNPKLTQPLACVNFTSASLDPPYLTVVSDATPQDDDGGVVVFRYDGSWTEVLRRNCVPVDVMLRIAQHFFAKGILPDWITWEEV